VSISGGSPGSILHIMKPVITLVFQSLPAGYPNATSASVTVKVKNESETFYVAFTNEKVRVYSYEDDGVVTALETWADGKAVLG